MPIIQITRGIYIPHLLLSIQTELQVHTFVCHLFLKLISAKRNYFSIPTTLNKSTYSDAQLHLPAIWIDQKLQYICTRNSHTAKIMMKSRMKSNVTTDIQIHKKNPWCFLPNFTIHKWNLKSVGSVYWVNIFKVHSIQQRSISVYRGQYIVYSHQVTCLLWVAHNINLLKVSPSNSIV